MLLLSRAFLLGAYLSVGLAMTAAVTSPSCKNATQAENAVFTTEQIVCMVIPLAEDLLTGTPEEIAKDIVVACPTLQGFTTEVVAFVNQWLKSSPAQKDNWKAFVAASRKGPRIYPVLDAARD